MPINDTDAVQANIQSALVKTLPRPHHAINVAFQQNTNLNQLFLTLKELLVSERPSIGTVNPVYSDFRAGDVLHSLANIALAREILNYSPQYDLQQGLELAMPWYLSQEV